MRKRHIAAVKNDEDENEINLTPMLDVVFIMLIFFIVTASFTREAGLDVNRPDQEDTPQVVDEEGAILVIVDGNNDIWMDGQVVDQRAVRAHIEQAHAEDPDRPVVVQVSPSSTTQRLVVVMDAARLVDRNMDVSVTTSPN